MQELTSKIKVDSVIVNWDWKFEKIQRVFNVVRKMLRTSTEWGNWTVTKWKLKFFFNHKPIFPVVKVFRNTKNLRIY